MATLKDQQAGGIRLRSAGVPKQFVKVPPFRILFALDDGRVFSGGDPFPFINDLVQQLLLDFCNISRQLKPKKTSRTLLAINTNPNESQLR
jgi:hypothetical protein